METSSTLACVAAFAWAATGCAPSTDTMNSRLGNGRETSLAPRSLASAARPEPAPGELVWAAPGNITLDRRGRAFQVRSDGQSPPTIALLDPASGESAWLAELGPEQTLSLFDPSCAFDDVLVVGAQKGVYGIDVKTGAMRWSTDLNHALMGGNSYPYLKCREDIGAVYVAYSTTSGTGESALSAGHVAQIDRATGTLYFTTPLGVGAGVSEILTTGAIVGASNGHDANLVFVAALTGNVAWTKPRANSSEQTGPGDELYVVSASSVARIDPATGRDLFTISANANGAPGIYFERERLYLLHGNTLRQIDRATGNDIWSYNDSSNPHLAIVLLPSGHVAVRGEGGTSPPHASGLTLLGPDGQRRWTYPMASAGASEVTDGAGNLFVLSAQAVTKLALATGLAEWTYDGRAAPVGASPYPIEFTGVPAADLTTAYVTYAGGAPTAARTGIVALHLATGRPRWHHDEPGRFTVTGSDAKRLYIENDASTSNEALQK